MASIPRTKRPAAAPAASPPDPADDMRDVADAHANALLDIKCDENEVRLCRDEMARRASALAVVRAVASSASIAGWVVWREFALVWGSIIAASQVVDATKEVFPFAQQQKAASEAWSDLRQLFFDGQYEEGEIKQERLKPLEVLRATKDIQKRRVEILKKHFPLGMPSSARRTQEARQAAHNFFEVNYVEVRLTATAASGRILAAEAPAHD